MIEVFITDIDTEQDASNAIRCIREVFPNYSVTVDLEDHERIMRIDSQNGPVKVDVVKDILLEIHLSCRELDH